jgi:hypothetical protein
VRISGFNWARICRYEVERGNAPLMILSVKPLFHKIRAIKTEREKSACHALINQLKPNTYMKVKIDKVGSFSTFNSHKEC